MRDVRRHNNDPSQTYTRAVNAFSDRTDAELRSMAHGALGLDRSLTFHQRENPHYVAPSTRRAVPPHVLAATAESVANLPASVDWRTHTPPLLTPIKNQGSCGSCWTFASTETAEPVAVPRNT